MIDATRSQLETLLKPWQRRLLGVGLALAVFLFANTVYLLANRLVTALGWAWATPGDWRPTALFQWMLLGHTAAGLLFVALMTAFVGAHLPAVWARRHRSSILSGLASLFLGATLLLTGLFILTAAASQANRWAWWTHVLSAALLPGGYGLHRLVSHVRPSPGRLRRFLWAVSGATAVLVLGHGLGSLGTALSADRASDPGAGKGALPEADGSGFRPVAAVAPSSPFFPSAATTSSGGPVTGRLFFPGDPEDIEERVARAVDRVGFASSIPIGALHCDRCHADIVEQWASSAHRFASFNNPFYEATVNDLRGAVGPTNPWVSEHLDAFPGVNEGVGPAKSKFCGGCHDPAVMLTGTMGRALDRRTSAVQAGLTCMACHAMDQVHGSTGNGNYNVADGDHDRYLFPRAPTGSLRAFLHDAAIRSRPAAHKRRLLKPFFSTAEYCAACHKVSLSRPINEYRWIRGQDEYDAWHDSGISHNASRTFYLPPEARVCQDCHMPLEPAPRGDLAASDGLVRSHRFLAVNTALPFVRGDTATLRKIEGFLRDERLRVDVFAVRRSQRSAHPLMPLDAERPVLVAGESVVLDVVVRNLGVGHGFPGGTNDSNQGWLELTVEDDQGRLLGRSGAVDPQGRVDPLAHRYGAVLLDAQGRAILKRNAQDIHVAAASNVIGPGTADVAHYELTVPRDMAGGSMVVRARLLWRKFHRAYTEFAFRTNPEGFRRFDRVPDLPITVIASHEVSLTVESGPSRSGGGGGESPLRSTESGRPDVDLWERFNDYGIALLLEGNVRLAEEAFRRVAQLEPARMDGALNLARTAIAAGDLASAYQHLEEVERTRRGDSRAAWVWGTLLQEDGRYDQAVLAYKRVLEDFPGDRAAWRNLGRTYYLNGQAREAVDAFDRVLAIDPEDRVSHYFRMLALRVLGSTGEAATSEEAFSYYAIDESAQAITRTYRKANPGVNLMAQAVHTHTLAGGP